MSTENTNNTNTSSTTGMEDIVKGATTIDTGMTSRNTSSGSAEPNSGHYRSRAGLEDASLGKMIYDTVVVNPESESDYRQGQQQISHVAELYGLTSSGGSRTGGRDSLREMYNSGDSAGLRATFDEAGLSYRTGANRTGMSRGAVLNDYRTNVNAVNQYLESKGIRGAQNLTSAEINTALKTGTLSRTGKNNVKLTPEMKSVLQEKQKLLKLEGAASSAKSGSKIAQVGKAWAREAVQDSDAAAGTKMIKTTGKAVKMAAKGTKAGTKLAVKAAPALILGSVKSLYKIKQIAGNAKVKMAKKEFDASMAARRKALPSSGKGIDAATRAKLKANSEAAYGKLKETRGKLSNTNSKLGKVDNAKSKLNARINDPFGSKLRKSQRLDRKAAKKQGKWESKLDKKQGKWEAKHANDKNFDKKRDKRRKKTDAKKLGGKKKFSQTKVGKVVTAPFRAINAVNQLKEQIKKLLMKVVIGAAFLVLLVSMMGMGLLSVCSGAGSGKDNYVPSNGTDLSEADQEAIATYFDTMTPEEEEYLNVDWAFIPYTKGSSLTTTQGIINALYKQQQAYIENLYKASYTSENAKHGIPSDWVTAIESIDGYSDNPQMVIKNSRGTLIGYDLSKYWGPKVEYSTDDVVDGSLYKGNSTIKVIDGTTMKLTAQAGLTNIAQNLATDNETITYTYASDGSSINSIKVTTSAINQTSHPNDLTVNVSYADGGSTTDLYANLLLAAHLTMGNGKSQAEYLAYCNEAFANLMNDATISFTYNIVDDYDHTLTYKWHNSTFTSTAKKMTMTLNLTFANTSLNHILETNGNTLSDAAQSMYDNFYVLLLDAPKDYYGLFGITEIPE